MTYPNDPGFAAGSKTSENAAATLYGREGLHFFILAFLYVSASTVDETKKSLEYNKARSFDRSTVAARFTELKESGFIDETEATRPSNRGKPSTVFKLTTKGRDYILNN